LKISFPPWEGGIKGGLVKDEFDVVCVSRSWIPAASTDSTQRSLTTREKSIFEHPLFIIRMGHFEK